MVDDYLPKIDKTRYPIPKTRSGMVKIRAAIEKIRSTREMGDFLYLSAADMRPDYSHKIFGDKRLHPFLRLETYTAVRF
jgi:hypothetical protein